MTTEAHLAKIKQWYLLHYPLCLFCGHSVRDGGDLAHIIRRSYTMEIMTLKLNTGLAHRECHETYDNDFEQSQFLPRIKEVMYIAWLLSPDYFNQVADNYPLLHPIFERFPEVGITELDHHGELLTLQYLVY